MKNAKVKDLNNHEGYIHIYNVETTYRHSSILERTPAHTMFMRIPISENKSRTLGHFMITPILS